MRISLLIFLASCSPQDNPFIEPPDTVQPIEEFEWKFVVITWEHPLDTINGKLLPLTEISGYYFLFTDVLSLQEFDFLTAPVVSYVTPIPPGNWKVEVFTLDINDLMSDPAVLYIDKEEFRNYDIFITKCVNDQCYNTEIY